MIYRRKFSKEFKLEAVRRIQSGQSVAESSRALEVKATELYRLVPGSGSSSESGRLLARGGLWPSPTKLPSWSARSGNRPWKSIF
jgi:transposase-like protein